ncbi:hypothetical protein SAMN05428966_10251 [Massilia sp. PDC64]|nr:hypothetical protein [Massilia sp. PDC64]SDC65508.1 hypothetical protein SAMN05428966_10251 [Massilia sp. PDC64]
MAVESVTYIGDLNPAFPTGSEPKSQGDDHLRNIKIALQNSFPGFAGAVIATGVDGGAANAYTLTPADPLPGYVARMLAVFIPTANNTGASTLNISALGAKPILSVAGLPLIAGDLTAGRFYSAFYDGTAFRLDNVTQNYVDQLVISGTLPGVNNPANAGKVFSTDGAAGQWISLDGRGAPIKDKGNSGTTPQVVNYADGEGQTITATGAFSLSASGFPAGRFASVLVRGYNLGAYALTSTGITWVKSDGTTTTNFGASGITFPASGEGFFALFSYGDGTIYGKAA